MATCETCRFWDSSTQAANEQPDTTGLCRVNAPVVDKRSGRGFWPYTSDTDWCRKYEVDPTRPVQCTKDESCIKPDGHEGECDEVPF